MNSDVRANIRLRWLDSIYELSHIEFQKNLWVEAKYPEIVGSFTEAICTYFNDLGLDNGYQSKDNLLIYETTEAKYISVFHTELTSYLSKPEKQCLSDSKVLIDPDWQQIVKIGIDTWNKLKKHLSDTNELKLVNELELKYDAKNNFD